ncbi:unnamed protein product [Pylaiella littoralis]
MQLLHGDDGRFDRFQQHALSQQPNYHDMRMPMGHQHAQLGHTQQQQQQPHRPYSTGSGALPASDRACFARPLPRDRIAPASHDLSTYDEGDTSSASEDSAVSSYPSPAMGVKAAAAPVPQVISYNKRAAEPSASFNLPPSQRSRTTAPSLPRKQSGWQPVSGGTFDSGISVSCSPTTTAASQQQQQQQQQQRQLPRLAALETMLSSRTQLQGKQQPQQEHQQQLHKHRQQPQQLFHQQQHHAGQQEYPVGAHRSTTPTIRAPMQRSNIPTMQLPPLPASQHNAAVSSILSSSSSTSSRSTSSSPSCSPSPRCSSPPSNNLEHTSGRYQLPLPVCVQGADGTAVVGTSFSGGSVNQPQHQRWLTRGANISSSCGGSAGDLRRQVPRINALSRSISSGTSCSDSTTTSRQQQQQQVWETASARLKPAGERMHDGVFFKTTTAAAVSPNFSSAGAPVCYDRGVEEKRGGSNWPRQHADACAPWSQQQQSQGMIRIQQHPSEAGRPSSRTPSPVSPAVFRSAGQDHVSRPQQLQHRHDHQHQLPTVASRPSPERIGAGARSWIPPVVDDGRVAAAAAAVSSVCGEAHGSGKWDEEAQARASGSVGKQILQRYLTHLYPKASREVWSHDEEEVLWRAQKEYGNAWNYISSLLPGRSENAVKNHWYTQMRMFIGQRGNNPSSSKPCPPTSSRGVSAVAVKSSSGGGGGGKGSSSSHRQHKRTPTSDDETGDASRLQHQQRRTSVPSSPVAPAPRAPAPTAAPAPAARGVFASFSASDNLGARPGTTTPAAAADEAESFDVAEEKQARADAVAALGMLFSQGGSSRSPSPLTANSR